MALDIQTVMGIDPHAYLSLLRRQASTVTVVTAAGDPPVGFTATSFTSVSLRPQLVSFCLGHQSSSWPTVEKTRHVAIHLLSAEQQPVAKAFAAHGVDRFADRRLWRMGPYGVPVLQDVLAVLTCEVVDRIAVGDHSIVIAQPVNAEYSTGDPLLYHMGEYMVSR